MEKIKDFIKRNEPYIVLIAGFLLYGIVVCCGMAYFSRIL